MKTLQVIVIIIFLSLFLLATSMRLLPINADKYHVDPLIKGAKGNEGGFFIAPNHADEIAPIFEMSKSDLAQKLNKIITENGRLIAGDIHGEYATYIFRSRLFAFPDYLSIRVIELNENQSTIAVYSRLRIGRKDLGVNRARVEAFLHEIN